MKKLLGVLATSLYLAGCGGGSGDAPAAAPTAESLIGQGDGQTTAKIANVTIRDNVKGPFTLMGTITGLLGSGLALDDGWGGAAMLQKSTIFAFVGHVPANSEYSVRVSRQPTNPTQLCTIENNHGRATTTVSNMAVTCVLAAKFAIVAQKTAAGGALETFAYDQATGKIGEKPLQSEPFLTADNDISKPFRLIRNPKRSVVYLVSEQRKIIEAFSVDEKNGLLTRIPSFTSDVPREGVAINGEGTRMYSSVSGTSNIVASELGENGEFIKGKNPTWTTFEDEVFLGIELSADGKHIYATSKSGTIFTLNVAENGDLSTSAKITGFVGLNGLAISPKSNFAFASHDNSNLISLLKVDQSGQMTSVNNFVYDGVFSNLKGLTFDSTGTFLFGTDKTRSSLFVFKIDQATGAPTLMSITTIDSNSNPVVSMDPQGRFVYVSAFNAPGFVRAFSFDANTGSLSEVPMNQTSLTSAHGLQLY